MFVTKHTLTPHVLQEKTLFLLLSISYIFFPEGQSFKVSFLQVLSSGA